ncbi:hypothetical protein QWZ13_14195 [Reinekea marina]|uniref:hypothetical protein n=1 Tax=Reinekea marina TaxID=1310421 RepID=UPI0025B5B2AB|nr:hypothetical protein [Reinekea marina]MDN3650067.1 hypothetical protein [Reinekea marina]
MQNLYRSILVFFISGFALSDQTLDFRLFLYEFFGNEISQSEYVASEYTFEYYDDKTQEYIEETRYSVDWEYLPGPNKFHCKTNCYDLIIYDNFQKTVENTGERVLSFEGVENGISLSLYFKLLDGKWVLQRYESISN